MAAGLPAAALEGAKGVRPSAAALYIPNQNDGLENDSAMSKSPQDGMRQAQLPAPLISRKINRLPDGNVEFCSGPGHQ